VTSLESEVDHLTRSLTMQRTAAADAESSARKAAEEHTRDASNKVGNACLWDSELTLYQQGTRDRTTETVSQELR
jgi:hypothetical protein